MIKKRQKRKNTNKLELKIVVISLSVFFIVLVILLLLDFGAFKSLKNIFHKQKPIVIKGECYSLFNTVLYEINSNADCQKQCSNECWVRGENYKNSKFILTPNSCNLCDCYCK